MCLLGLDFLHNYKVDIKLSTNTISINGEGNICFRSAVRGNRH